MSHVVTIKAELKDLAAVKAACQRLGWQFCEGQTTFEWWGRWENDYDRSDAAYQNGIKPEEYGKCDHAIKVPGAKYEIGLVKRGNAYIPVYDNWMSGGLKGLTAENGLGGFVQAYGVEKAKAELRRRGLVAREIKEKDGRIRLVATAR